MERPKGQVFTDGRTTHFKSLRRLQPYIPVILDHVMLLQHSTSTAALKYEHIAFQATSCVRKDPLAQSRSLHPGYYPLSYHPQKALVVEPPTVPTHRNRHRPSLQRCCLPLSPWPVVFALFLGRIGSAELGQETPKTHGGRQHLGRSSLGGFQRD